MGSVNELTPQQKRDLHWHKEMNLDQQVQALLEEKPKGMLLAAEMDLYLAKMDHTIAYAKAADSLLAEEFQRKWTMVMEVTTRNIQSWVVAWLDRYASVAGEEAQKRVKMAKEKN
jgi:hypothetical protein